MDKQQLCLALFAIGRTPLEISCNLEAIAAQLRIMNTRGVFTIEPHTTATIDWDCWENDKQFCDNAKQLRTLYLDGKV